ncbi:MAG: hypothetical protein NT062_12360 [Proteobacteria bacterium]|nr:hypothetical protein [Pseudomonadota bacterium]
MSATGAPTGACTMAETCTIAKAITLVDTGHRYVKLAGGNYPVSVDVTDKQFTMHAAGATIGGGFQVVDTSDITIRGADIPGGLLATSSTATPKITFEHVTLLNIIANPATVTLRDSRVTPGTQNSAVSAQTNGARASSITLDRTVVDGGDGMCIQGTSQLHVTNSVIANQIPNSSLLYCNGVPGVTGQITIEHSTLYEAPIACATGTANVHLINTIVARAGSADAVTGSRCELAYTLVTPSTTALIGSHILQNADPMFTSPTTGDFHLRVGSAAIDAGDPTTTPIPDLDGTPRPQGAAVDLGAFEYKPLM